MGAFEVRAIGADDVGGESCGRCLQVLDLLLNDADALLDRLSCRRQGDYGRLDDLSWNGGCGGFSGGGGFLGVGCVVCGDGVRLGGNDRDGEECSSGAGDGSFCCVGGFEEVLH